MHFSRFKSSNFHVIFFNHILGITLQGSLVSKRVFLSMNLVMASQHIIHARERPTTKKGSHEDEFSHAFLDSHSFGANAF